MKRYFYFIIPIIICVVSLSFSVRTKAAEIEPYNMLANNQSGVGQQYIDIVKERIRNNYNGFWGEYYSWALSVPDDEWIVIKGTSVWGAYSSEYTVLLPREYYDSTASSSIVCSSFTSSNDIVDSVTLQFNDYCQFFTSSSYLNDPFNSGSISYGFTNSNNYELVFCYKPIYCNGVLVVDTTDDITIDANLSLPQLGSLTPNGHSSTVDPFDALGSGVSFTQLNSSAHSSGHSVSLPSTSPTFDFTSHTENLLGQIINNTNNLISNTSLIVDQLNTLNWNMVSGISAMYNAISGINQNIVSIMIYDEEKVNDAWEESYAKQFFDGSLEFGSYVEEEVQGYSDYFFEGAGPSSLEIPIDFTVWEFSTEDFGDFAPFDQIYYMRFPFLDETKALWQPILLGLLYFGLVYTLFTDFPNILRGAVR